jgi:hypothetical protein
MALSDPPHLEVKINDARVEMTVEYVDIEDHDRLIDRAKIVIDDPKKQYRESPTPNAIVSIVLGWPDEKAFLFEGVLQKPNVEDRGNEGQKVTLTAFDRSYLVKKRPKTEAPEHKGKLSEVVKLVMERSVAPEHGIVVDIKNITPSPDPKVDFVQPGHVDDWGLIQRLAIENGCRAFVEVESEKSTFFFKPEAELLKQDPMGVLHFCNGFNQVLDFNYKRVASAAMRTGASAIDDPKTGETVSAFSAPDQPTAEPKVDPDVRANIAKTSGEGAAKSLDSAVESSSKQALKPEQQISNEFITGLPSDPALMERLLKRDPTRLIGLFGEGTAVGTVKMRAKGRVTITGIASWAAGDWYVTRVNHIYTRAVQSKDGKSEDRSTYRTKFAVTR